MAEDPDIKRPNLRAPLRLHFVGPAVARRRIPVRDLMGFVGQLQIAVDRVAIILGGEVDSIQRGRRTAEIERACSLELTELRGGGSVSMTLDLPNLVQRRLPGQEDAGEEALRVLIGGIHSISVNEVRPLPAGFDQGVLLALREFGKGLDRGYDRIDIDFGLGSTSISPVYTLDTYRRIVGLIQAPVRNRLEVEGRLLMADFKETGLRCRIHPPIGQPVSCTFTETQRETVLAAITHYVRVIGEALFVEGQLKDLSILDVEIIDRNLPPLRPSFTYTGSAEVPSLDQMSERQRISPLTDASALYGDFWQPDEGPDEFLDAVQRWRRERSAEPST